MDIASLFYTLYKERYLYTYFTLPKQLGVFFGCRSGCLEVKQRLLLTRRMRQPFWPSTTPIPEGMPKGFAGSVGVVLLTAGLLDRRGLPAPVE